MKRFCISIAVFLVSMAVFAQEQQQETKDAAFVTPSVKGLQRPKMIILNYEVVPPFQIKSSGRKQGFHDASNEVRRNGRLDARLKFPIVYRNGLTIAMGFKFFNEEFHFSNLEMPEDKDFITFQDRSLKSAGSSIYVIKSTHRKKYYALNLNFDFNGDFNHSNYRLVDFLKFSITPLMGWKIHDDLSYAIGVSYSYTFGAPMLYPVISYNRNFNKYWGVETLLPAHAKIRYSPGEKVFYYGMIGVSGAAYRLNNKLDSVFKKYNTLHLHRSEIKLSLSIEREIHDWLWFSLEAGFRHSLRFNITNSRSGRKDIILANKLHDGVVVAASIFVVPPRSLMKKIKK